jgi:Zn-finger nucleic acid-binding protein
MVDVCPNCHGLWLDRGELEVVEEISRRNHTDAAIARADLGANAYQFVQDSARPPVACLKCGRETERREYARVSQVLIDACPDGHGLWLERGALEALEVFYESSRADARRREVLAGLRALLG